MARSYRYTPIFGICAGSEKQDKRLANRLFRHKSKLRSRSGSGEFLLMREVSDVWAFTKDGKYYRKEVCKKDMRK